MAAPLGSSEQSHFAVAVKQGWLWQPSASEAGMKAKYLPLRRLRTLHTFLPELKGLGKQSLKTLCFAAFSYACWLQIDAASSSFYS